MIAKLGSSRNASWLVVGRLVKVVGSFAIALLLARALGPEQFGLLSYAIAFISFFNVFTRLGLEGVTTRFLSEEKYSEQAVLSGCFGLKLGAGLLGYAACSLLGYFTQPDSIQVLIYILGLTLVFQCLETPEYWFNARLKSRTLLIAYAAGVAVGLLAIVACILTAQPLWVFATALALQSISGFALLFLIYAFGEGMLWVGVPGPMLQLLKDSYPIMLAGFAVIAYMRIDQVMIQAMIGPEAVGMYAIAANFSESWYFIPVAITQAFLPIAVRHRAAGDTLAYHQLLHRLFRYLFFFSVLVAVVTSAIAPKLVIFFVGEAYKQSATLLIVHTWGGIFVCFGLVRGLWVMAENRPDLTLKTTILGACLNIILNFFMIKAFGAIGAAVSTVIARAVAGVGANILFEPLRPVLALQLRSVFQRS